MDTLKSYYLTGEQNGRWAFENEEIRAEYLKNWSAKQGVKIISIQSEILVKNAKKVGRGYSFYIVASNTYQYSYIGEEDTINTFRLGTYHSLDLIPGSAEGTWVISREWYDDPLSNFLDLTDFPQEVTQYILAHDSTDISDIGKQRISAVEYADTYCGAASIVENNFQYNSDYTNYNSLGGDCANFASQILYEGGNFKKNSYWNYSNGKGSRSWVNAQAFKDYLLYSGRGSLIASGRYQKVYQLSYSLLPGDIIAYAKKGKVTHISIVTGLDSKGYPLVNCHNTDRYRVPWDLGWSGDTITFYFIRVNY